MKHRKLKNSELDRINLVEFKATEKTKKYISVALQQHPLIKIFKELH